MRITEAVQQVVAIYPGRFHPFHKGHASVYDYLKRKYGNAYVATSNKVDPPKSPFSFPEKRAMMLHAGIPSDRIVQTKNPYKAEEILDKYDPETTAVVFAVSAKDMADDPRFSFAPKKDGSPSYFQPLAGQKTLEPFSKHGYIEVAPTLDFKVLAEPMRSATELRKKFATSNTDTQKDIITDLYGTYNARIHSIMANKINEAYLKFEDLHNIILELWRLDVAKPLAEDVKAKIIEQVQTAREAWHKKYKRNKKVQEGDLIPFPDNTIVLQSTSDEDWYELGKDIANLSKAEKAEYGHDDSDILMVLPAPLEKYIKDRIKKFTGLKFKDTKHHDSYELADIAHKVSEEDQQRIIEKIRSLTETIRKTGSQYTVYSKKGKRMGTYPSKKQAKKRLQQIEYFKHVGEAKEGSYLLQLEHDDDMLVLHIKSTKTGQRTEVRGKPNYEGDGYDATDPLHQLLDKVGKAANISELMNGEVVSINPSHPQGPQARATVKDIAGESQLNERATDIVYHYTNIGPALNILKSGEFQLSSVAGSVEQDINPKGYNFFLSTARSKGGEYHSRVGDSAVMFVLNGRWISDRYPVKPVDYWAGMTLAGRSREAEDRIFSKDPTMPIAPVTSIHVLLKEQHPFASAKTRQFLIRAKTLGIPTYLYKDESAWRLQNTAKAANVEQMKSELSGPEKFRSGGSGSRWLLPWLEVIFGKTDADLGKKAKDLVRSFRWYHSPSEPGSTRGDDHGLGNELNNARKPGNADREDAVKILKFMQQNRMLTHMDLVNYLVDKWKVKDESVNEMGVGRVVKGVNTTPDVGPDEIKKQAAKMGFKVDRDGRPPLLHAKARKNSDPNTLFNLGLIESVDYVKPQFDVEWEEANRYPYLEKLGQAGWEELAGAGKVITVNTNSVKNIENTGADGSEALDDLEPEKVARLKQAMDAGTIEMPIVVKQSDGSYSLVAGNTRLIGLITTYGKAKVWLVDASNLAESKELSEKRRFPDKNQKESLLSSLLKYEGQNVFISFQRVRKLGINPKFNFDGSPLGVYSYFLPAVLDDFKKLGSVQKGVDFGSERPYVFVFKVNDLSNVINVETYSNTNLKKDLKRLNLIIQDTHEDASEFFAKLKERKKTKYPFEILMKAIAVISEYKPSYMRKLFVQLGYYGIMDNVGSTTTTGHYTIKESIFFSTEHIKVIDMFINHNPNKDDIPYKDGKEIDDPFSTFDVEYDYTEFAGPAKTVKTVKPDNNRPLEVIDPGLTHFEVGDKISQEEYDQYKEYGLKIKIGESKEQELDERGSITVPFASGTSVTIAPHRPLRVKKSTKGRLRYENPTTNTNKSKRGKTV